MTKRIFFVVGHENYGKSYTLRSLLDMCERRGWRVIIRETEIMIRRMSNDDQPKPFIKFMKRTSRTVIIAALCPKFERLGNSEDNPDKYVDETLRSLKKRGYDFHFWVLQHQWGEPYSVTPSEIGELKRNGHVEVLNGRNIEAKTRAKRLRAYISKQLSA